MINIPLLIMQEHQPKVQVLLPKNLLSGSELRNMVSLNKDPSGNDIIPYERDLSNNDLQNDPDYTALNWGDHPVAVNYIYLIPYLVKSNQEQQNEIESLKSANESMMNTIQSLDVAPGGARILHPLTRVPGGGGWGIFSMRIVEWK